MGRKDGIRGEQGYGYLRGRRRGLVTVGACAVAGAALLTMSGAPSHSATAATRAIPGASSGGATGAVPGAGNDITIASPRPFFVVQPNGDGQGPVLSGTRLVWTAYNGEGRTGTEADRIYCYNVRTRRLGVLAHSYYGTAGFIGSYILVGDQLAYVDTTAGPGGIFAWRVVIDDVRVGRTTLVASSANGPSSTLAPQIAFDGTHLLFVQTVNEGPTRHGSLATLYTPSLHRRQVLQRAQTVLFGNPALGDNTALWTAQSFGATPSSRLMAYDMTARVTRALPVGDVSQVAANGALVVWKSGVNGGGPLVLYSLRDKRVLSGDLAHGSNAVFPSIGNGLIAWTYANSGSAQIYSLSAHRVIYNAPGAPHRAYGPTSVSRTAVSWVYTVLPPSAGQARGYLVVHQVR